MDNLRQSVIEDENADDFEIMETVIFTKVNSVKMSRDNEQLYLILRYIAISNQSGYKIYWVEKHKIEYSYEKKYFEVFDLAFVDQNLSLMLLALEGQIVFFDTRDQHIVQSFPLLSKVIHQLTYCKPFIVAAFDDNIIAINQNTKQAYKYLTNVIPLNNGHVFVDQWNLFNYCLCYSDGSNVHIDSLSLQKVLCVGQGRQIPEEYVFSFMKGQTKRGTPQPQFATLSQDSQKLLTADQVIYLYHIDWKNDKIELQRRFYRGQTRKELQLFFGPDDLIACISLESEIKSNLYDATLHLFYDHLNDHQPSKKRYYFRTWAPKDMLEFRSKLLTMYFPKANEFTIVCGFNFLVKLTINKQSQLKEWIHDSSKITFLNLK